MTNHRLSPSSSNEPYVDLLEESGEKIRFEAAVVEELDRLPPDAPLVTAFERWLLEQLEPPKSPTAKVPNLTRRERRLVDAATSIYLEDAQRIAYQHSVLCQAAMPYQRVPDRRWDCRNGRIVLRVTAGEVLDPRTGEYVDTPLPFGSRVRLILMHVNAEALRQQSPTIEVETSLTAFQKKIIGRTPNGREIAAFRDQLTSLAAAQVRLGMTDPTGQHAVQVNTQIITALDLWAPGHPEQKVIWPSIIRLSTDYYDSLVTHAVPLDERAIAALANSAMALDIYAWLAQRLHRIPPGRPQFVAWAALHEQFGAAYRRPRDFRRFFLRQVSAVSTQYPDARVDHDLKGLLLTHSPPPVKRAAISVLTPPTSPSGGE